MPAPGAPGGGRGAPARVACHSGTTACRCSGQRLQQRAGSGERGEEHEDQTQEGEVHSACAASNASSEEESAEPVTGTCTRRGSTHAAAGDRPRAGRSANANGAKENRRIVLKDSCS